MLEKKFSLMEGKKGIVCGLTNTRSIGYGIAKALSNYGAEVALSYQDEVLLKRIQPIADEIGCQYKYECDVLSEESIAAMFDNLSRDMGKIDFIVHSIAFSDKKELQGMYLNTSVENFLNAMNISCFSFTMLMKYASRIMNDGGSALTLTYDGSQRIAPNYNVMGLCKAALESSVRYLAADLGSKRKIRVNAVSAGPVRTLAASGINDFNHLLDWHSKSSLLRRNITIEEVGNTAAFLLSDMASGITAEVLHVDSGYHAVGLPNPESIKAFFDEIVVK